MAELFYSFLFTQLGLTLLFLWFFWAMYVFVMGIYRAYLSKRLGPVNFVLGFPLVLVGAITDIVANLVIAPIVFLDIPREWLVTTRLLRYRRGEDGWRKTISTYICDHMLDVFDPTGNHC